MRRYIGWRTGVCMVNDGRWIRGAHPRRIQEEHISQAYPTLSQLEKASRPK
jgi:hypothetical protein